MMPKNMIAVDASGGDYAPREIVKGAIAAAEEYKINIALVGKRTIVEMLTRHYATKTNLTFIEASETIEFNEHPAQAIRSKPNSSIVVGINLVKDGIASAFISAGNTGAVLAASFIILGRIEGVHRPALCGVIQRPSGSPVLLIDAGANADCQPEFLVQFGQLGSVFARGFLGIDSPRVALLNNGEEEIKGNLLAKESHELLKRSTLNFIGNMEGHEIRKDKADVIVTDGFTGNIVLKTMEGFGDTFGDVVDISQASNIAHLIQGSALVHYMELASMIKQTDYKEYGGACLLGVNGNVIVAHGRSQAKAMKNAIHLAHRTAQIRFAEAIRDSYKSTQKNSSPTITAEEHSTTIPHTPQVSINAQSRQSRTSRSTKGKSIKPRKR